MDFIKKNLEHFTSLCKYLLERALCIFILLVVVLVVSYFFFSNSTIVNPEAVESQEILFCGISLSNLGTWLTAVTVAFTAIWSMYQYTKNRLIKQQERASEIAKSFSDQLLLKCTILKKVIEHSNVYELLEIDKKAYAEFKTFNANEIRTIYNSDDFIERYNKAFKDSDMDQIYYRILDAKISFSKFDYLNSNNRKYSVEEATALFKDENSIFPFHFTTLISDVLNELEYLCMSLSSQAAGSRYVYQSLHQILLRTVRLLCVHIAKANNTSYCDKYYTNLIYVYNEWTNLYLQALKKEQNKIKKVNGILNPKIKTV